MQVHYRNDQDVIRLNAIDQSVKEAGQQTSPEVIIELAPGLRVGNHAGYASPDLPKKVEPETWYLALVESSRIANFSQCWRQETKCHPRNSRVISANAFSPSTGTIFPSL